VKSERPYRKPYDGFSGEWKDWEQHWKGMPDFLQKDERPFHSVRVNLKNPDDLARFSELMGQTMTKDTRSTWYPPQERIPQIDKCWVTDEPVNPRHPVYVISKGRWESRLTSRALENMEVPYHIVVEPQEYDNYAAVIDPKKILVLPFSNLGQGSIPARNWVWQHSIAAGASWHWILDDNIKRFYRLYNNTRRPVRSGVAFRAVEDFVDRYDNVGQAGLQYAMFAPKKWPWPAFRMNTRIYSCILNRNDGHEHRWRGRYNEDTDLSLRILKDGWCTVLFFAFLADKIQTMVMKGGNTDELYKKDSEFDGRYEMAKSLQEQHPDVVRIKKKWGRWQHSVDYTKFKWNLLRRKKHVFVPDRNEYGMHLVDAGSFESDRVLLIGQAPSENGSKDEVLCGKIGRRLSKLADMEFDEYVRCTDRVNVFDEWPGKKGKGDAWDAKKAEKKAKQMLPDLKNRHVLFVGRNVADAFGFRDLPFLQWRYADVAVRVAVIPHPSGIVTWWNDPDNRMAAADFLKEAFKGGDEDVGAEQDEE